VGADQARIVAAYRAPVTAKVRSAPYGDGRASEAIISVMLEHPVV